MTNNERVVLESTINEKIEKLQKRFAKVKQAFEDKRDYEGQLSYYQDLRDEMCGIDYAIKMLREIKINSELVSNI